jgi:hypothetical protein
LPADFASWETVPTPVGAPPKSEARPDAGWLPDPESVMRLDVGNEPIEFRSKRLRVV